MLDEHWTVDKAEAGQIRVVGIHCALSDRHAVIISAQVPAQRTAVFKIRHQILNKWLKQYDDHIYYEEQKVAVGVVQRAWVLPRLSPRRELQVNPQSKSTEFR